MKLAFAAFAIATLPLSAQDVKHVAVPTDTSVRPLEAAAHQIVRESNPGSIVHLKGDVVIKTPVCTKAGPNNALNCDGSVVVRADEADLNAETGQIDARGHVTVTREK